MTDEQVNRLVYLYLTPSNNEPVSPRKSKRLYKDIRRRAREGDIDERAVWILPEVRIISLNHISSGLMGILRNDPHGNSKVPFFQCTFNLEEKLNELGLSIKIKNFEVRLSRAPKFFLFSGTLGFSHAYFKELLASAGVFPYPQEFPVLEDGKLPKNFQSKLIKRKVFYLNVEPYDSTYDKSTYELKCEVHNIVDIKSIENLAMKANLHKKLAGTKYIAETENLQNFTWPDDPKAIYILRPSGRTFYSGKDILVANSKESFDEAKKFYEAKKRELLKQNRNARCFEVIVSKYITNPILWNGLKMHLRLYMVVTSLDEPFSISRFGKILTSAKHFELNHFDDPKIHDTHLKYTPRDLFYPRNFTNRDLDTLYGETLDDIPTLINKINTQLEEYEKILTGLCTPKPYDQAQRAYAVLALDIMIKRDGTLVLIEINDMAGIVTKDPESPESDQFYKQYLDWVWEKTKHLF